VREIGEVQQELSAGRRTCWLLVLQELVVLQVQVDVHGLTVIKLNCNAAAAAA
jgi:hypothetical protein